MSQVTLDSLLSIEQFDPMKIDVQYINQTINEIPKHGRIDINQVEILATKFLRCSDYVSEIVAQLTRWIGHKDSEKKAEKSRAIARKMEGIGTKDNKKIAATIAAQMYGDDSAYIATANTYNTAEAALSWFQQKQQNLIRAHVLCKDLLKQQASNLQQQGWQGLDPEQNSSESSIDIRNSNTNQNNSNSKIKTPHYGEIEW